MAVCPSDTAVALVALKAKIVTTKKTWEAADFFKVPNKEFGTAKGEQINAIDTDEIVKEIQVPVSSAKSTYKKWAFRKAIDFPQVSVAVVKDGNTAEIALGGVYNEPKAFSGVSTSDAAKAGEDCLAKATALETTRKYGYKGDDGKEVEYDRFSNKYKIQIAKVMIKRAIQSL